jgi:Flp pilus assembly pilin Flp
VTRRIARKIDRLAAGTTQTFLRLSSVTNARARVRLEMRREVNQMLKFFTVVQVAANSLLRREEGQTMAEYGVVLAVITLTVIGAITLLSGNVRSAIESVANVLP